MTFYKGDTSNYIGLRYKKMLHIRIINAQGKMRHNVSCFERILHVLFITFVRVMNDLS